MAAPDWSNTTEKLLKTSNIPNNTQISFGDISRQLVTQDNTS